jgi:hypothetical protein
VIAAFAMLAALSFQDTVPGLSPRARAMLDRFTPPSGGQVSVGTRFSADTVWIGQQLELVTAAWFPRELRDRLRRQPTLRTPSLSGLWSAPNQTTPTLAETRRVNGRVYDLFISHQTLFPLGAGAIEAPPAVLTYAVPASSSFFAPEDRTTLESRVARLYIRPIPASLAARLGSGPTARDIRLQWRLPNQQLVAGTPVTVDLVVSGQGNVTLWPAPEIAWAPNIRVYSEPTEERITRPAGLVSGEKRFRYTLVADSVGVLTLPRVRYPYFDPELVQVRVAMANGVGVAVLPTGSVATRAQVSASRTFQTPIASRIVRTFWPVLVLLALLPFGLAWRYRRRPVVEVAPRALSLEEELRRLVGQSTDAAPGRVSQALRRRGIARHDAALVERWLAEMDRHRWGPAAAPPPDDAVVTQVVNRLRRRRSSRIAWPLLLLLLLGAPRVGAQWDEALSRFADGDGAGASRLFEEVAATNPAASSVWFNIGAARWAAGDDVGSVAAWLQGSKVAPRDPRFRDALEAVPSMPRELHSLAPTIPLSRDELVLLGLVTWLIAAWSWRRRRNLALATGSVMLLALGTAITRTHVESRDQALIRPGATLRVSPVPTAPTLEPADAWSVAVVERQERDWLLVALENGRRGWLPKSQVAPLARLD